MLDQRIRYVRPFHEIAKELSQSLRKIFMQGMKLLPVLFEHALFHFWPALLSS